MLNQYNCSLVIPVYNEVDNIQPLLAEIHSAIDGKMAYEVVIVDDGSQDGTQQQLQQLALRYPLLRIVTHRSNYGQSASTLSGVLAAQHQWIVTLDGDLQNDPADIPLLFAELHRVRASEQRAVAVLGIRSKRHDNWLRRSSSRFANSVRRRLLKDECVDTGCSLKVFPREIFLQLPHFDHFHRFLPALLKRSGLVLATAKVNHRPRNAGQSKYGVWNRLWVGIDDLLGVMWLLRRPCRVEVDYESQSKR